MVRLQEKILFHLWFLWTVKIWSCYYYCSSSFSKLLCKFVLPLFQNISCWIRMKENSETSWPGSIGPNGQSGALLGCAHCPAKGRQWAERLPCQVMWCNHSFYNVRTFIRSYPIPSGCVAATEGAAALGLHRVVFESDSQTLVQALNSHELSAIGFSMRVYQTWWPAN
jgi:hypothetical protein